MSGNPPPAAARTLDSIEVPPIAISRSEKEAHLKKSSMLFLVPSGLILGLVMVAPASLRVLFERISLFSW